jgi:hypothetical protein
MSTASHYSDIPGTIVGDLSAVPAVAIPPAEAASAQPPQYQHVPLPMAGSVRVRYSPAEPLRPRRFEWQDDST